MMVVLKSFNQLPRRSDRILCHRNKMLLCKTMPARWYYLQFIETHKPMTMQNPHLQRREYDQEQDVGQGRSVPILHEGTAGLVSVMGVSRVCDHVSIFC